MKTQSISQRRNKAKSKQTTINQSALSIFHDLLHRLEQVAIQIWVVQLVVQLKLVLLKFVEYVVDKVLSRP